MKALSVSIRRALAAAMAGALLAACGGDSSTPSSTEPAAGPARATVSTGVMRVGNGTLRVNGVTYATDAGTVIRIGGEAATLAAVRSGMVGTVRGQSNGATGLAEEVEIENEIQGAITAINAAGNPRSFSIGMQQVIVSGDTRYDDLPHGFDSLRVGMLVEVFGMRDAAGALVATLVEDKSGTPELPDEVKGTVSALNRAAGTFNIGNVVVNFAAATFLPQGANAASLADGLRVEAEGEFNAAGDVFVAARVEIDDRTDQGELEIEGFVAQLAVASGGGSGTFMVGSQAVSFDGTTRFRDGTAATLANNVHVEVEGAVLGANLRASVIRFVPPDEDDDDDDDEE
jgi:hypothetical protein